MRVAGNGHVYIARDEWGEVEALMREDESVGGWMVLHRSYRGPGTYRNEECIAIRCTPQTMTVFLATLVQVLRHPQDSPEMVLEDVKWLASQVEIAEMPDMSIYYLPRVQVN